MEDILRRIIATKRRELDAMKRIVPPEGLSKLVERTVRPVVSMKEGLLSSKTGIIAEFKRRSPSKGDIAPMASVGETVSGYSFAGASGCSILTDTPFFGGSIADLAIARTVTKLPLLRKDFIIDEYQIDLARIYGADTILLIAAVLSKNEIERLIRYAHSLQLEVLLELHDRDELDKWSELADMTGVNNRNLSNFNTDLTQCETMIKELPSGTLKIAESGIKTPDDLKRLRSLGFRGFLIGEALMSAKDPSEKLKTFVNAAV
ncbi:MAG: indole-3-glycerol phosphate synthase TrpC [Paramuribaculum sp.]|nr:indole-3-glycerol phosphate synthase TrpC [Paramuribaculum sp.]